MRVTIKDIARETNLSPTTVSLVLNNKPHRLAEETRKRVWETAKRMNYRPNSMAASLKTRKTKTVGMVVSDFANAYFGELAKGAEAKCAEEGYALILCNTTNKSKTNINYINILIDRGVDGIILSFGGTEPGEIGRLTDHIVSFGIPVIMIDCMSSADMTNSVILDNLLGGYIATCHLLEQGHTRIGCITGPIQADDDLGASNQRYLGYCQALREYQIPINKAYVKNGEFTIESGVKNAPELVAEGVTGIVAANDLCAYGIYKWARDHQIVIPDDLSVVGYDDIVYSDFFSPRLTTVRQPAYDMGYEAARKLIGGGTEEPAGQDTVFKPELVVRGSTAHSGGKGPWKR